MQRDYVPRMIDLERSDYNIVKHLAEKRGLSEETFLAALRKIVREWKSRIPNSCQAKTTTAIWLTWG